ncbi:CBASS cGAMP-activated phospholipase [Ramlibacter sp.]|uniref:CBASS cGAMP-activated phospholipase n=1 Tax=Ramlibacter sp. TaxID=1917967 RepID=UPI002D42A320|nr:CBASS cGAMP-activated phospholipase [Ramlibacter sp.]HYD75306.1 CBASS cGAMP-activated phospholipase [Ramlibacter sp.]
MRRILSLGGGGIKGAATAAYLAHLEEASGRRIADCFDLIAGTSTGGIIAIALASGVKASDLVEFYIEDGPAIFPKDRPTAGWCGFVSRLRRTKYDPTALREALTRRLGERLLGGASTRLVIPAVQPARAEMYLFKTRHHPLFRHDHRLHAVDVAMATSAAPTYLPQHLVPNGGPFADGGLWANNPVGVAVAEAVSYLDWAPETLRVLSIETPQEPQVIPDKGLLAWSNSLTVLDRLGALQSSAARGTALALMRDVGNMPGPQRFMEGMTGGFPKGYFGLDETEQIKHLIGLGAAEARKHGNRIGEMFLSTSKAPFTPCP